MPARCVGGRLGLAPRPLIEIRAAVPASGVPLVVAGTVEPSVLSTVLGDALDRRES